MTTANAGLHHVMRNLLMQAVKFEETADMTSEKWRLEAAKVLADYEKARTRTFPETTCEVVNRRMEALVIEREKVLRPALASPRAKEMPMLVEWVKNAQKVIESSLRN